MSQSLPTDRPVHARVWQELQCATQDREHEWRTPVLATVGLDGSVQARTVVLRRADGEAQQKLGPPGRGAGALRGPLGAPAPQVPGSVRP